MRTTALLLLVLASVAMATVAPGQGLSSATIYEGDIYAQDMAYAFDLSKTKYPLTQATNTGKIYGDGMPIQTKDFSQYGVEKLNMAKWVSHNIGVFVYDSHKVIIQVIDGNGKLLLKSLFYDFNVLQNLYCTGFEYNDVRNLLYVGCFGQSGQQQPGKLFVFTYDLHLQDVTSTVSLDQKDGFLIRNQLELRIVNAPQTGSSADDFYLIAYDQGHGQATQSRSNHQFRVFRNITTRTLTYYYLGDIDAYDHDHSILYDLWAYQDTIISTGRT